MRNTPIQWTHSTINPVMGCDGCELWPSKSNLLRTLKATIEASAYPPPEPKISEAMAAVTGTLSTTSEIHAARKRVAADLVAKLQLPAALAEVLENEVRKSCKCYAGLLGTMRPGHAGYADRFEQPKTFTGRMAKAARWAPPSAAEIADKTWLTGAPRMIFISDMGDALSQDVDFEFLKKEIIESVDSIGLAPPLALVDQAPRPHGRVWPMARRPGHQLAGQLGRDDHGHFPRYPRTR